jgi:hypothetical protein
LEVRFRHAPHRNIPAGLMVGERLCCIAWDLGLQKRHVQQTEQRRCSSGQGWDHDEVARGLVDRDIGCRIGLDRSVTSRLTTGFERPMWDTSCGGFLHLEGRLRG